MLLETSCLVSDDKSTRYLLPPVLSGHEKKWSQLIAGRQAALNVTGKQFRDSIPLPSPLPHAKSPNPTRLVPTWYGRHAEYEVILTCGKQQRISCEQFSKFSLLAAAACTEKLQNCRGAWSRIVMAQPGHRCLNREYLSKKCKLLEVGRAAKREVVSGIILPIMT